MKTKMITGIVLVLFLASMLSITPVAASPSLIELQSGGNGTAVWTTAQKKFGWYSVKLNSGTMGLDSWARVVLLATGIPFVTITDISFWYRIDSESTIIPGIQATWPIYVRDPDTVTNGYFSPYIIFALDTNFDFEADAWVISQPWAEPAARLNTWRQWLMKDDSKHWSEACWHNHLFENLPGGPVDAGWEPLSSWKKKYPYAVILEIKLAIGEWAVTQPQIAYVDDVTVTIYTYIATVIIRYPIEKYLAKP